MDVFVCLPLVSKGNTERYFPNKNIVTQITIAPSFELS